MRRLSLVDVNVLIQALLLGHIAEAEHHTLSVLEKNFVFAEGNQLCILLRVLFMLLFVFLKTGIFLFGLCDF